MTPPAVIKKQTCKRQGAKPIGRHSPPTKTPLKAQSGKVYTKAIVVHGVPCDKSIAHVIQDAGRKEIMGAHKLLGGKRRVGKVTSSVVFLRKCRALGRPVHDERALAAI